jgi:hypothetical protein
MQPAEKGKPQNAAELSDWDRTVYTYFGKRSAVVPLGIYLSPGKEFEITEVVC